MKYKNVIVIFLCILIGLFLRFFLAYNYLGNFDQQSYEIVAQIVSKGGNVYAETSRYNYSPIWFTILSVLYKIPIPFQFSVRSFLTIIDAINTFLIFRLFSKEAAIIYWLNPVSILLVGFHGQFETLAMLPILIGYKFLSCRSSALYPWLFGTLALVIKHNMLFLVFALYLLNFNSWVTSLLFLGFSVFVFLMSFLPFLLDGYWGILNNVFLYRGLEGYGISTIVPMWSTPIFITVMVILLIIMKKKLKSPEFMIFSSVAFLALMPGYSTQYFLLPFPFAVYKPTKFFFIISLIISIWMLTGTANFIHPNLVIYEPYLRILVWIVVSLWFLYFFKMTLSKATVD